MAGGLSQIITRWQFDQETGDRLFLKSADIIQHKTGVSEKKKNKGKKTDQVEEEKESSRRKELCNPWALARTKEMELILFMWER